VLEGRRSPRSQVRTTLVSLKGGARGGLSEENFELDKKEKGEVRVAKVKAGRLSKNEGRTRGGNLQGSLKPRVGKKKGR